MREKKKEEEEQADLTQAQPASNGSASMVVAEALTTASMVLTHPPHGSFLKINSDPCWVFWWWCGGVGHVVATGGGGSLGFSIVGLGWDQIVGLG